MRAASIWSLNFPGVRVDLPNRVSWLTMDKHGVHQRVPMRMGDVANAEEGLDQGEALQSCKPTPFHVCRHLFQSFFLPIFRMLIKWK